MAQAERRYYFLMPESITDPVLINPELGIDRVRLHGGADRLHHTITAYDSSDHRLASYGIYLFLVNTNKSLSWQLHAVGWQPMLANETSYQVEDSEIPPQLAQILKPLLRNRLLMPCLSLRARRTNYLLLTNDGILLGSLLDEKLSSFNNQRRVLFRPSANANEQQIDFVINQLRSAGAVLVDKPNSDIARLKRRLTTPPLLTGEQLDYRQLPLSSYLKHWAESQERKLIAAELKWRSNGEVDPLSVQLARLAADISGLAQYLPEQWCEQFLSELAGLGPALAKSGLPALPDSYYQLLEQLAVFASPTTVEEERYDWQESVVDLLERDTTITIIEIILLGDQLTKHSDLAQWQELADELVPLARLLRPARRALANPKAKRRAIRKLAKLIVGAVADGEAAQAARDELLTNWPQTRKALKKAWGIKSSVLKVAQVQRQAGEPIRIVKASEVKR